MNTAGSCDDRAREILEALAFGKSRDDLSKELGYKSYKSIDMYMRRRNYRWDSNIANYVADADAKALPCNEDVYEASDRENRIIALFKAKTADPITIAHNMGFHNHREMAEYMKIKGYIWDSDTGNYKLEIAKALKKGISEKESEVINKADTESNVDMSALEIIERNKDKLLALLCASKAPDKIPRYVLPGVFVTKSVHMTSILDILVREFSREKNISQREIFEVALIEFFEKYGYGSRINSIKG